VVLAVDAFPFPATPIPTLGLIMAPSMTRFFLCTAAASAIGMSAVIPTSAAPASCHNDLPTTNERLMLMVQEPVQTAFQSGAFAPLIKELKKASFPEVLTVLDEFTKDIPEAVKELQGEPFAKTWAAFRAGKANALIADLKADAKVFAEHAEWLLNGPAPLEGLSPAQVRYYRIVTFATEPLATLFACGAYDPLLAALQHVDKATAVAAAEEFAAELVDLPTLLRDDPSLPLVWALFRAGKFDADLFLGAVKQAVRAVMHKMVAGGASGGGGGGRCPYELTGEGAPGGRRRLAFRFPFSSTPRVCPLFS